MNIFVVMAQCLRGAKSLSAYEVPQRLLIQLRIMCKVLLNIILCINIHDCFNIYLHSQANICNVLLYIQLQILFFNTANYIIDVNYSIHPSATPLSCVWIWRFFCFNRFHLLVIACKSFKTFFVYFSILPFENIAQLLVSVLPGLCFVIHRILPMYSSSHLSAFCGKIGN